MSAAPRLATGTQFSESSPPNYSLTESRAQPARAAVPPPPQLLLRHLRSSLSVLSLCQPGGLLNHLLAIGSGV